MRCGRRQKSCAAASACTYSEKFRRFPMFVVPNAYVLEKARSFECHEDLVAKGALVEHKVGMGPVTFVSHTWLSFAHPDPRNEKLALLKGFMEEALTGTMTVQVWWLEMSIFGRQTISGSSLREKVRGGSCWIDFCSVPQHHLTNQQLAIASIPSYVADAALFLCIAPPSKHQDDGSVRDVRGWKRRGWCRMERLSNELSPLPKKCIVLESPSSRFVAMSRDWLFSPVGAGAFQVEADKALLGPMVLEMLHERQASHLEAGDLTSYRMLECMKVRLLEGFEVQREVLAECSYEGWMSKMRFASHRDGLASGWTPLRYALYAGQLAVARELLRRGADVSAPLSRGNPRMGYHGGGCTILHGLAFLRDAPAEIELLLAARASPWKRARTTALHLCFVGNCCANIDVLMRHDPALAGALDSVGQPVYMHAILVGNRESFAHFRRHYPQHLLTPAEEAGRMWSFMSQAVVDAGDPGMVADLLAAGYDADRQATNKRLPVPVKICQAICYFTEPPPETFVEMLANANGSTPLVMASYFGNLTVVELLLQARASVLKRNCYGRGALHLAAMQGHHAVVRTLLAAGAPPGVTDTWRRTPADWASLRGHSDVAQTLRDACAEEFN